MATALRRSPKQWGLAVIWFHWIMAPLLVLILAVGFVAEHAVGGSAQRLLYEVHFSLGLFVMLLALARLGCRAVSRAPRGEDRSPTRRWSARAMHFLLYLAMLAALASGWVNFMFLGPVRVFGLIEVPRLFDPETQEPLRALSWYVHYYSYWLLLLLVALHMAAALHHHFVLRDRILLDFLPGRR